MIRFSLSDFTCSIGADYKSHYQRKKTLQIFKDLEAFQIFKLQTFTLEDFDDFEFCSSVIIPYLKIKKKRNLWNVTLLVANQFYEYNFPFQFTDYFIHWGTNHQFEVKTQIIQLLAQKTIKKKLDVEEFLKPFDKLSNAKKTRVKKIFIQGIEQ
jgi:hypothetical protein